MKQFLIIVNMIFISTIGYSQMMENASSPLFKKRIIKKELFSSLTGNITLGYEQHIKNFTSIEGKIGVIGIVNQEFYNAQGVFLKVGPKFKIKPNYPQEGIYSMHILKGAYIRPEIVVSVFNQKEYFWDRDVNDDASNGQKVRSGAILINYGRQYVLGGIITIDWYIGVGYAFSNEDEQGYHYGFIAGRNNFPMAVSGGCTMGVLF